MFGNKTAYPRVDYTKRTHLDEIYHIEKLNNGGWTIRQIVDFMQTPYSNGMVALDNQNYVVGYCFYTMLSNGIDLKNFGVLPDYFRNGFGTRLINRLKTKLVNDSGIFATIPECNMAAHKFMSSLNFRATHVEKNYYGDGYFFEYKKEKY